MKFILKVVKYAGDRLHIEIPVRYKKYFRAGDEVIIEKDGKKVS